MLEGPGRIGVSDADRLPLHRASHTIRHDTVRRKIAASDDISRSGCGNRNISLVTEKRLLVRMRHDLRTALGVRIGIVSIQLFILLKGVICKVIVLIDLICRDI